LSSPIVIAGAGGMGREAVTWLTDLGEVEHLAGFVAAPDTPKGTTLLDLPVWADLATPAEQHGRLRVVMGVGSPGIRRRVAEEADDLGLELMTVVHPLAYVGETSTLGRGAVIGPYAIVPRENTVGIGALVYYHSVVGHDVTVGDFAYVAPHVSLGGHSTIEDEVFLGLGATVLPTLTVGTRAVVGAGALVTRDVAADATVVGSPARPLGSD
jgi:sugar O-acyltransferase (sialic acid O-acetyltransferase NeuD family)